MHWEKSVENSGARTLAVLWPCNRRNKSQFLVALVWFTFAVTSMLVQVERSRFCVLWWLHTMLDLATVRPLNMLQPQVCPRSGSDTFFTISFPPNFYGRPERFIDVYQFWKLSILNRKSRNFENIRPSKINARQSKWIMYWHPFTLAYLILEISSHNFSNTSELLWTVSAFSHILCVGSQSVLRSTDK